MKLERKELVYKGEQKTHTIQIKPCNLFILLKVNTTPVYSDHLNFEESSMVSVLTTHKASLNLL